MTVVGESADYNYTTYEVIGSHTFDHVYDYVSCLCPSAAPPCCPCLLPPCPARKFRRTLWVFTSGLLRCRHLSTWARRMRPHLRRHVGRRE